MVHTHNGVLAIKKNTFESVPMRWMTPEPIIQSEVSQKEKQKTDIFIKECDEKEYTLFCESTSTGSQYLGGVREAFHKINSLYISFTTNRLIVFSQNVLGIHTKETRIERDMCTPVFIAALFIIARTWKQPT